MTYADHTAAVNVSLDGVANDGTPGENDVINNLDIENLTGGAGADTLTGNAGPNTLIGGLGADTLVGGGGTDTASYADRTAAVSVTASLDGVANDGAAGEGDLIGPDIATVRGGAGADTLIGGAAVDTLIGGLGADTFVGGAGIDTVSYADRLAAASVTASLDGVANDGAAGEGDQIAADIEGLTGSPGADTVIGGAGPDTLDGGLGNDTLIGGPGADTFRDLGGTDTVTYAGRTAPVSAILDGLANDGEVGEGDFIQSGVENLTGGAGNDTLTGDAAANILIGGAGADTFAGGAGTDTVTYADRTAPVSAILDGLANDGEVGEGDFIQSGVENLTGGAGNDTLIGDGAVNVLIGGAGADTFAGGAGSDTVTYFDRTAAVSATLDGLANDGAAGEGDSIAADVEVLIGGAGNDTLTGNGTLTGGAGNDLLTAGAGNDSLDGGAGDDTLLGGLGGDKLSGGAGNDTVSYADHTTGVKVTIDGVANDGVLDASGVNSLEGDNVGLPSTTGPDVENVIGSSGDDLLIALDRPNFLQGGPGNDILLSGSAGTRSWVVRGTTSCRTSITRPP